MGWVGVGVGIVGIGVVGFGLGVECPGTVFLFYQVYTLGVLCAFTAGKAEIVRGKPNKTSKTAAQRQQQERE